MAVEVKMPQLSDTMNSGKILSWKVREGDKVSRGDILAEVETDKANLEIECFHEGTVLKILTPEGTDAAVGTVIAMVGAAGEGVQPAKKAEPAKASAQPKSTAEPAPKKEIKGTEPAPVPPMEETKIVALRGGAYDAASGHDDAGSHGEVEPQSESGEGDRRIKASPLARRLAAQHGLSLSAVRGTGPEGRILRQDVERAAARTSDDPETRSQLQKQPTGGTETHAPSAIQSYEPAEARPAAPSHTAAQSAAAYQATPQAANAAVQSAAPTPQATAQQAATPESGAPVQGGITPLSKMRATIARRMEESVRNIPHFYVTTSVDMRQAARFREAVREDEKLKGVTINHLVIKAAAFALEREPRVNCSYRDGALYDPGQINIGIITALDDGLIIPVVKETNTLPLAALAFEVKAAIDRARAGRPSSTDLSGGTFCISNMGMFDVDSFTAIISPGQGAILAVSSVRDVPVVEQGMVVPGKEMKVTLSVDHRIIDGVIAARFLQHFVRGLENPALLAF